MRQIKFLITAILCLAAGTASAWNGSGTAASPYLIENEDDLVTLATNSQSNSYEGVHFRLTADLDMNGVTIGMIGNTNKSFKGTFDGYGHAIRNLTINESYYNYAGLFACTNSGCVIKNLIIDGANITVDTYAAALVDDAAYTTIENCLVVNSNVTATSTDYPKAGIIARTYSNCTFTGNYYYNCSVTKGSGSPVTTDIGTNSGDKTGIIRATDTVACDPVPDGWGIATGDGIYYDGNIYTTGGHVLSDFTLGPATWPALQAALSAASTDADNPTELTLAADITASASDSYLTLSGNRHVVLDLNGHTLSRGLTAATTDGHVISVSGSQSTLTIRDSGTGGTITGGWSTNGCGAINFGGATLTIEGGTISGNKVTMQGGSAIRCTGTVYMTGGTITGNMVSMDNYSTNQCGTIYLMNAHFYMSGGTITGNYCGITTGRGSAGIGMSLNYSGVVHLSGSYNISGNLQGTYNDATGEWTDLAPSDILNHKYLRIDIDGAINPEAPARLILNSNANDRRPTFTSGWSTYMGTADPEDYFTLADNTLGIGIVGGEATIGTKHTLTLADGLTASVTSAAQGKPITLGGANAPSTTGGITYDTDYIVSYNDGTDDHADHYAADTLGNATFLMPDADATVTAEAVASVTYIDENGDEQTCTDFTLITSSSDETYNHYGTDGQTNWYVVSGDVSTGNITFFDSYSHLILCDGASLTTNYYMENIRARNGSLAIYGQTNGTGSITAIPSGSSSYGRGFDVNRTLTINGGNITARGSTAIMSRNIVINRGTVNATGDVIAGIEGNVVINGGNVTAAATDNAMVGIGGESHTVTLGWTSVTDRITSTATATNSQSYVGTVSIKDGQYLYNGTEVLSGTITDLTKLQNVTLQPAVKITLPDGVTADGTNVFIQTDGTYALPGATVTLAVPTGYTFSEISSDEVTISETEGIYSFIMPAVDVTVSATIVAIPYAITLPESFEHGSVTCEQQTATVGETVTLTVTPDEGYELETLIVTTTDDEPSGAPVLRLRGGSVELTPGENGTYTFAMPAAPVTVNATFKETVVTGVEDINAADRKRGQRYNIMGQPVADDYKGIVIEDGRKRVIK